MDLGRMLFGIGLILWGILLAVLDFSMMALLFGGIGIVMMFVELVGLEKNPEDRTPL